MRPMTFHAFSVPRASASAVRGERDGILAAHGRARDEMHITRRKLELRGAVIGGEIDRRAARDQRMREGFSGEQMPAGAAGTEEDEFAVR